jgi:hypothetical protein
MILKYWNAVSLLFPQDQMAIACGSRAHLEKESIAQVRLTSWLRTAVPHFHMYICHKIVLLLHLLKMGFFLVSFNFHEVYERLVHFSHLVFLKIIQEGWRFHFEDVSSSYGSYKNKEILFSWGRLFLWCIFEPVSLPLVFLILTHFIAIQSEHP